MLMLFAGKELSAQVNEGFEGATFPPTGWTNPSVVIGNGDFYQIASVPRTGINCAISEYTPTGADNYLITPQFTPISNDSLVFYFSQQFTAVYDDSLEIKVSTTGNLPANFTTRLRVYKDGVDYPLPGLTYLRVAISLNAYSGVPIYIAFRHADLDGENIRIDDVSTKSLTPDVAPTANIAPAGSVIVNSPTIAPKATFSNLGGGASGAFNVTYVISPGGYTSTKSTSLAIAESKTITFDSTFVPNTIGTYNVTIYCFAATDPNKINDTLKTTFNIIANPNFGTGTGTISFANSIATGAPSKPEVCWPDTAGGITLCREGINNFPAVFTGTLDDGYWRLGGMLPAGYKIRVNGVDYDSLFVGTNGIIGVTATNASLADFSPGLLPDAGQNVAFFPLWKDFDFRTTAGSSYMKIAVKGTRLYIYGLARSYTGGAAPDAVFMSTSIKLVNTAVNSNIVFQYGDPSKGTTASFVTAINANTLADHVIGMQSGATQFAAYRQRITTLSNPGPIFSTTAGGSLAVEFGPDATKLNSKCATLNLNVCLEVCAGSNIKVSLFSVSTCSILDSKTVFLPMTGPVNIDFAGVDNTTENYYIKVEQENSLTIWSNLITFTGFAQTYNFTSGYGQVFGGANLTSSFCMISGDANRDGGIDGADLSDVENDAISGIPGFISGWQTDLSCDGVVDATDIATIDNNSGGGFFEAAPGCPVPNGDNSNVGKVNVTSYDRQVFLPEVDKTTPFNDEERAKFDFYHSNNK